MSDNIKAGDRVRLTFSSNGCDHAIKTRYIQPTEWHEMTEAEHFASIAEAP